MIRPAWIALGVGAAVAVTLGGAALIGPPGSVVSDHPAIEEPVVRSSLVCPFVDGEAAGIAQIAVLALPDVALPEAEGAGEPQPITVSALALPPPPDATAAPEPPADAAPVVSVPDRGVPVVSEIRTPQGTSFAVAGYGVLAPGLAAEQSLIMQEADLRGISTAPCTAPSRDQWFVGGSAEVGRRGRLVLANPTDVPAVVDISLWDEAGPIDAAGTKDVGVPARSQRVLLLDALAPESAATGVHVSTNRGRVSAALEMRETDGITPQGMTYIPAAVAPAHEIAIPGVPKHGERTLRILAPGEVDAIVSMRILGPDGAFTPLDQGVLTVTAGSVVDVPLDAIGTDPAGLRLESDEPITAAVRVVDRPSGNGLPEVSYTAASAPLSGPAPALLSRVGGGFSSTLIISSVIDVTARVTVRTLAADGTIVTEEPLDITAGATIAVPLTAPKGLANATVIVVPDVPGSVVAAREIIATDAKGVLADLMPLTSPTTVVDVPEVVGELPDVPEDTSDGS